MRLLVKAITATFLIDLRGAEQHIAGGQFGAYLLFSGSMPARLMPCIFGKRDAYRNLPLGVVDNDTLGSTIEVVALVQGDRLCIFADGVTEPGQAGTIQV